MIQVFTDTKEELPVVQAAAVDVDDKAEKTFHSRFVVTPYRKSYSSAFCCRICNELSINLAFPESCWQVSPGH